jgi:hypothetical protein
MPSNIQELEDLLLSTLSFYEAMTFSKIVFDINTELLKQYPDFDRDQMLLILSSLEKRGLVMGTGIGIDRSWKRIHKKRSFWKRFF